MSQNVPEEEEPFLEEAILHALADFEGPIAIGLRSGHVDAPNITLPLGVQVEVDLTSGASPNLNFLEASVY
jgi:muramoyltetrapeptide carboxypeptidase